MRSRQPGSSAPGSIMWRSTLAGRSLRRTTVTPRFRHHAIAEKKTASKARRAAIPGSLNRSAFGASISYATRPVSWRHAGRAEPGSASDLHRFLTVSIRLPRGACRTGGPRAIGLAVPGVAVGRVVGEREPDGRLRDILYKGGM